ncbi:hypothetical protein N9U81_04265 [Candidatus Pelagibacter sp.]|nr:hypothetical protein [Candidatus Pelagibacter sp.]|tara:strand:+ start:121 stop:366 length:246 start_codon:yes stop_codon:yes gene_type:complete
MIKLISNNSEAVMRKKLKKNEKKKIKILRSIDKLKNKITAKEKKLSSLNIKIAGLEKKVAEKKAKKIAKKNAEQSPASINN